MNADECRETYQELEKILQEYNLDWVSQQVNETLREGKTVEEPSQSKSARTSTKDYTLPEQLLLLIDAVEQALVNTVEMEKEISEFLLKEQEQSDLMPVITFYSEDKREAKKFNFSSGQVALRQHEASELKRLLESLRVSQAAG